MWKDKPTGIKILWIWTIGTAAILLTGVSRTRMRDMEKVLSEPQQQHQQQEGISSVDHVLVDDSSSSDDNFSREDKL